MNDEGIDRRLGALLRGPEPKPDPAFADRVLRAASIENAFAKARRRAWRRALVDCGAAAVVGLTFFLLSQTQEPEPGGIIPLEGPAMAGLVMLLLWGLVALPISGVRSGVRVA